MTSAAEVTLTDKARGLEKTNALGFLISPDIPVRSYITIQPEVFLTNHPTSSASLKWSAPSGKSKGKAPMKDTNEKPKPAAPAEPLPSKKQEKVEPPTIQRTESKGKNEIAPKLKVEPKKKGGGLDWSKATVKKEAPKQEQKEPSKVIVRSFTPALYVRS